MAQQTASPQGFARELAQSDLNVDGTSISIPADTEMVVCYVLPENRDDADALAAKYGLVCGAEEMDRVTFVPEADA